MNDAKDGDLVRSRPMSCTDSAILTLCLRHCRSKYRLASSWEDGVGLERFLRFVLATRMRLSNCWAILNPPLFAAAVNAKYATGMPLLNQKACYSDFYPLIGRRWPTKGSSQICHHRSLSVAYIKPDRPRTYIKSTCPAYEPDHMPWQTAWLAVAPVQPVHK